MQSGCDAFTRDGFCLIPALLDDAVIIELEQQLTTAAETATRHTRGQTTYGMRDVVKYAPSLRAFARSSVITDLVQSLLGESASMVRAIYFNKTAEANWQVAWHQDGTIALKEKHEVAGFSGWSCKDGIVHVRPPEAVLKRMLTLRIHLDRSDAENGALRVIPCSHHARIPESSVRDRVQTHPSVLCPAPRGAIFAMRPLLLHASSAGTAPSQRRVLHLEFAPDILPSPLHWHDAI